MTPDFLQHLLSPLGNELEYREAQHALIDQETKDVFPIENGVPVLLPREAEKRAVEVTLSNGVRAKFFYLDHYRQDAAAFDYFEAFPGGASPPENRRLHESILSRIPENATRILDVGCGNAWVAAAFANTNKTVFSMDVSLTNPAKALQKYPFAEHYALVGDVYALPFRDNQFDAIIAAEVMEHTPDPAGFIKRLLRVLKPGGTLLITTPYDERIPHSLCVHCNRVTPHNAHLHSFNAQNVGELLPERAVLDWKTNTFVNKMLVKLRTHHFLQYLPFSWWKKVDALANRLFSKPLRLLITIRKS